MKKKAIRHLTGLDFAGKMPVMDGVITDRLVTVDELADYLHIKRRTIYVWAERGKIPMKKISRKAIRFNMPEVLDVLNNGHRTPQDKPQGKKSEEQG